MLATFADRGESALITGSTVPLIALGSRSVRTSPQSVVDCTTRDLSLLSLDCIDRSVNEGLELACFRRADLLG